MGHIFNEDIFARFIETNLQTCIWVRERSKSSVILRKGNSSYFSWGPSIVDFIS